MATILIGISLIILFAVSNAAAYDRGSKNSVTVNNEIIDVIVFYAVSAVEEGELINDHLNELRSQAQKWMDLNKKEKKPLYEIQTRMAGNIIELTIHHRHFLIKA